MAWLAGALDSLPKGAAKPDILLLQIRSFPPDAIPRAKRKTWFYQSYAPIDALFNVRTTGQLLRDAEALKEFEQAYSAKADFVNAC